MAGPPESIFDWTREIYSDLSNQNMNNQAFSRKLWRLLQCQNGEFLCSSIFSISILCNYLVIQVRKSCCGSAIKDMFLTSHFVLVGLRIFEELLEVDYLVCSCFFVLPFPAPEILNASSCLRLHLFWIVYFMQPRSCSRAMKAVGVVEASCEEVFELVMSMDGTRFE